MTVSIDSAKVIGLACTQEVAISIIRKARNSINKFTCPYRRNCVRWCIWMTAFENRHSTDVIQLGKVLTENGMILPTKGKM